MDLLYLPATFSAIVTLTWAPNIQVLSQECWRCWCW